MKGIKGTALMERAIEELPKNNYKIAQAMRKAGYSESSCYSGAVRRPIREYTKEIFNPDKTKRKILKFQKLCLKKNDLTNYSRMLELEARVDIPELRKQEIHTDNPDKIIIQEVKLNTQPVDNSNVIENKGS